MKKILRQIMLTLADKQNLNISLETLIKLVKISHQLNSIFTLCSCQTKHDLICQLKHPCFKRMWLLEKNYLWNLVLEMP